MLISCSSHRRTRPHSQVCAHNTTLDRLATRLEAGAFVIDFVFIRPHTSAAWKCVKLAAHRSSHGLLSPRSRQRSTLSRWRETNKCRHIHTSLRTLKQYLYNFLSDGKHSIWYRHWNRCEWVVNTFSHQRGITFVRSDFGYVQHARKQGWR